MSEYFHIKVFYQQWAPVLCWTLMKYWLVYNTFVWFLFSNPAITLSAVGVEFAFKSSYLDLTVDCWPICVFTAGPELQQTGVDCDTTQPRLTDWDPTTTTTTCWPSSQPGPVVQQTDNRIIHSDIQMLLKPAPSRHVKGLLGGFGLCVYGIIEMTYVQPPVIDSYRVCPPLIVCYWQSGICQVEKSALLLNRTADIKKLTTTTIHHNKLFLYDDAAQYI